MFTINYTNEIIYVSYTGNLYLYLYTWQTEICSTIHVHSRLQNHSLATWVSAGLSRKYFVVLEMHTNTVCSVVKYGVQK
jgi:hypothetical protein